MTSLSVPKAGARTTVINAMGITMMDVYMAVMSRTVVCRICFYFCFVFKLFPFSRDYGSIDNIHDIVLYS